MLKFTSNLDLVESCVWPLQNKVKKLLKCYESMKSTKSAQVNMERKVSSIALELMDYSLAKLPALHLKSTGHTLLHHQNWV